jgi:outer membrane protein assembly factor BamB
MGGLMIADGKLIIMSSKGDLIIAGAAPDGYKELARATEVLTGDSKRWTMPVLSGGRIYCRNHGGQIVTLDVRGK